MDNLPSLEKKVFTNKVSNLTVTRPKMHVHNVKTNLVGRTRNERIISRNEWKQSIEPLLQNFLQDPRIKRHKALIGKWVVEYLGNDEHMHEFFVRNWKHASPDAQVHVRSYVIGGIKDREAMKILRGIHSEEELDRSLANFLKDLENKKYRNAFKDEKLRDIEKFSREEQREIALFAPSTIYCAAEASFASLNTNYYGQLKSKSSLGPLEEILTRKAKLNGRGEITNPKDVWISMHAGGVEYANGKGEKKGIVLIAPTGTGKSTQGYGLVEANPQCKLHSDDWVFVNAGTHEVIISENQFYMRTNIAEIYPHLIPLLVNEPLENVAFTPDIVNLIESFDSVDDFRKGIHDSRVNPTQYQQIIAQMIENNDARSLIDPRIMVGEDKFIETMKLTNLFLLKRDFDDRLILKNLTPDEMEAIMTSKENVCNHVYGQSDADGYGIPTKRTTEIYYNPYLCVVEVERENGKIGTLDQIRIETYRTLARSEGVTVSWINTRLPASQTQLCIRKFFEGGIDEVRVIKGIEIEESLQKRIGLTKKEKPQVEGRRKMDLIGLYDPSGEEVEVVTFFTKGKFVEAIALAKSGKAPKQLRGYSEGAVEEFLRKNQALSARQI
ncbi:MAG: hypothetical protein HY447_00455, partial [Candidatus Omnitrophica bacterium]|nr:hypothetical protein [Candidatus Omnitrophota bacterium]